jgi:hypothetical protein
VSPKNSAADRAEIYERLVRYAGDHAVAHVEEIASLLGEGQVEQAQDYLAKLDAQIGGYGIHSRLEADTAGREPYMTEDRPIYRPIDYVIMHFSHPRPEWYARDIAEMACAHIEGIIKRLVQQRNLPRRLRHKSLGIVLRNEGVEAALPKPLLGDLRWLNGRVYNLVKHEFGLHYSVDEEGERAGHLFTVEEALAIYVIARHLAVGVREAGDRSD